MSRALRQVKLVLGGFIISKFTHMSEPDPSRKGGSIILLLDLISQVSKWLFSQSNLDWRVKSFPVEIHPRLLDVWTHMGWANMISFLYSWQHFDNGATGLSHYIMCIVLKWRCSLLKRGFHYWHCGYGVSEATDISTKKIIEWNEMEMLGIVSSGGEHWLKFDRIGQSCTGI